MKIILLGCGYLGYNLASLLSQKAETEIIGLPSPYTPLCSNFKEINAFSAKDLDQVDFEDVVVIDTISLLANNARSEDCLLYTSPSPRDRQKSRMPSSA